MRYIKITEHEPCAYNVIFIETGHPCETHYIWYTKELDNEIIKRIEAFMNFSQYWNAADLIIEELPQ